MRPQTLVFGVILALSATSCGKKEALDSSTTETKGSQLPADEAILESLVGKKFEGVLFRDGPEGWKKAESASKESLPCYASFSVDKRKFVSRMTYVSRDMSKLKTDQVTLTDSILFRYPIIVLRGAFSLSSHALEINVRKMSDKIDTTLLSLTLDFVAGSSVSCKELEEVKE